MLHVLDRTAREIRIQRDPTKKIFVRSPRDFNTHVRPSGMSVERGLRSILFLRQISRSDVIGAYLYLSLSA